jgi:hypothetical protein
MRSPMLAKKIKQRPSMAALFNKSTLFYAPPLIFRG